MKLHYNILPASALLLAAVASTGCVRQEADYFDQPAAVRIDAARNETKALLISAANGWEMSYFADNDWEEGYVLLMKFNPDDRVEMAGSNAWVANAFMSNERYAVQRMTSLYKMISDDGPVLSFDTFNKVLHIFSEPYNLPSSKYNPNNVPFPIGPTQKSNVSGEDVDVSEAGFGHNGDYEFVVLSRTNDEILLRGKKTGVKIRMRRLADDVSWEEYFAKVNKARENTFSTRFGDLKMVVDGHTLKLGNLNSGVMTILADNDDPLMETVKMPFLYTADGIRLKEPYTGFDKRLADVAIQNFKFDEAGNVICTDKPVEFGLSSTLPEIFLSSSFAWKIDLTNATGKVKEYINAIQVECAAKSTYKALKGLTFDYDKIGKVYRMRTILSGSTATAYTYGTPSAGEGNVLNIVYDPATGNSNGVSRVAGIPSLKALIEYWAASKWTVSTPSPLGPTTLVLTNVDDASTSFTVAL